LKNNKSIFKSADQARKTYQFP